jgi:nitrite reductase/ring-hydroxylating ferredoxin subunit
MKKSRLNQLPEFDSATAGACPINPSVCGQLTRRDAVRQIGGWSILAGALGGITVLGQACGPASPAGAQSTNTPTPTPTGTPVATCGCGATPSGTNSNLKATDIALDAIAYNATAQLFILHDANGFYCMDALCTHDGVDIGAHSQGSTWSATDAASGFYCGAHGSRFDRDGAVVNGPAGSPLPHYQLAIDGSNSFWIDYHKVVTASCRC